MGVEQLSEEGSKGYVVDWRTPRHILMCAVLETAGDAVGFFWKEEVKPMMVIWLASARETVPVFFRKLKALVFRLIMRVRRRNDRSD